MPDELLQVAAQHDAYMRQALELANEAARLQEVPVGAIVIRNGEIIARAGNAQITACDPTAHAEVNVLRIASKALGNYRLPGCTVYSTVEPCLMCAGALLHARVDCLVYGAPEPRAGAASGSVNYFAEMTHVHKLEVIGGVLEGECRQLIQSFFKSRRVDK